MVGPQYPLGLAQQAQQLEEGLRSFDRISSEAVNLLGRLEKQLEGLNGLNAPIFERAVALRTAEQNIAAAKNATDELIQFLGVSRKVAPTLASLHALAQASSTRHVVGLRSPAQAWPAMPCAHNRCPLPFTPHTGGGRAAAWAWAGPRCIPAGALSA